MYLPYLTCRYTLKIVDMGIGWKYEASHPLIHSFTHSLARSLASFVHLGTFGSY